MTLSLTSPDSRFQMSMTASSRSALFFNWGYSMLTHMMAPALIMGLCGIARPGCFSFGDGLSVISLNFLPLGSVPTLPWTYFLPNSLRAMRYEIGLLQLWMQKGVSKSPIEKCWPSTVVTEIANWSGFTWASWGM